MKAKEIKRKDTFKECRFVLAMILVLTLAVSIGGANINNPNRHVIIILQDQYLSDAAEQYDDSYSERIEAKVSEARKIYSKIESLGKEEKRTMGINEIYDYEMSFLTENDITRLSEIGNEIDNLNDEKRKNIINEVQSKSIQSQNSVIELIENCDGQYTGSSYTINSISAVIPYSCINELEASDLVADVIENRKFEVLMDVSAYAIKSNVWWNNSINGTGFEVAVTDTGVDDTHPALNNSVSASRIFHDDAQTDPTYNDNNATTDDLQGHGTHVSGSVASRNSTYRGVAFGSTVINAKVCFKDNSSNGICYEGDNMRGIDWAVGQGADIISRSLTTCDLGTTDCDMARYMDAVVDDLNIHVVNAAGNSGISGVSAVGYNGFSVAATNDQGTVDRGDDSIASFSSRGPTVDGRTKPDITVPGNAIKSARHTWEGGGPDYIEKSGTSMAAPQIAGAIALVLDYKGINWNPMAVRALFYNTAESSGTFANRNEYGFGYLNLDRAYAYKDDVILSNINEGESKFYKVSNFANGEKATLTWNRHVLYNGNNFPSTWYSLNNLDLFLYNESENTTINSSESSVDNAEQVIAGADYSNAIVKIKALTTNFTHNDSNVESFALGTEGGYTEITAPALNTSDLNITGNGTRYNITAVVSNLGGLNALGVNVLLNLPTGATITLGSNPSNLGVVENNTNETTTWEVQFSRDGSYTFSVTASSDSYGETFTNRSRNSSTILETGPPSITFVSPTPDDGASVNSNNVTINVTLSEDGNATLEWDGTNYIMDGSGMNWGRTMDGQSFGLHSYKVFATDANNNTNASAVRTITINSTSLQIIIHEPNANFYSSSNVPVNITLSENAILNYTEGSSRETLCSNCTFYNGSLNFSDGSHVIEFIAIDSAGNSVQNNSINFTVDTTAPAINSYNYDNGSYIAGNSSQIFGVNYTESNTDATRFYWRINGSGNYSEANLTGCANGTNVYCETTLDLSSHSHGTTINFYFIVSDRVRTTTGYVYDVIIDREAPAITNANSDVTNGLNGQRFFITATITDFTTVTSVISLYYQNGTFIENVTMLNTSTLFRGNWTVPTTPENYTYRIDSRDIFGNLASSNTSNLSTNGAVMSATNPSETCIGSSYTIQGTVVFTNSTGVTNKTVVYSGLLSGNVLTNSNGDFSVTATASANGTVNFTASNTIISKISMVTTRNCASSSSSPSSSAGAGGSSGLLPETISEPETEVTEEETIPTDNQTEATSTDELPEGIDSPAGGFGQTIGQGGTGIGGGFFTQNARTIGAVAVIGVIFVYGVYRLTKESRHKKLKKKKRR